MSYSTIRTAIEQRFYDNWTGTNKDTNVRYSNVEFEPPSTAWASLDVHFIPSKNSMISGMSLTVRRQGVIIVGLYGPIDQGTGPLLTLVDEAVTLFENQQFSSIQCLAASPKHVGVPTAGGNTPELYHYKVTIPFFKYE